MANLSNINNKLLVGTNGEVRIGDTATVANVKLRVKQTSQTWTAQFINTDSSVAYGISVDTSASSYGLAGTLQCYTNAGGGFIVRNDSRVGIGTTSPDSKLDVKGASATPADGNQILSITNTTGGTQLNLGTAENSYGWIEAREGATLRNLLLNPNGGNVGIATSSPDRSLDVRGTGLSIYGTGDNTELMLRGQVEGTGTIRNVGAFHLSIRGDVGGDNDDLKFLRFVTGTYSGIAMQIQNTTGNVGIGTASPANKLFVTASTAGDYAAFIENTNSTNGYGLLARTAQTGTSSYAFAARAGSSDIFVVRGDGNVGIGTTGPNFKLQIQGGTNTEETVLKLDKQVTGDTGGHTTILGFGTESGGWAKAGIGFERTGSYDRGKIHFLQEDTVNTDTATLSDSVMTIDSSGNVGIGIDPSYKFEIKSSGAGNYIQHFVSSDGASLGGFYENADTDALFFLKNASGAIKVEIDSDGDSYFSGGNVGIGTTLPQQLLHISNTSGNFGAEAVLRGSTSTGTPKAEIAFKRATSGDGANMVLRTSNSSGTIQDVLTLDTSKNATFTGNVTAPELRLQGTGTTYLNIGNNTTGSASSDGASIGYFTGQSSLQIVQRENDAMVFSTNSDERMRIYSGGQVNIQSLLTVGSTRSNTDGLILAGSNNNFRLLYNNTASYRGNHGWRNLQFGNNGSNDIIAGNTAAGGYLRFFVNNTNDNESISTPNGTQAMTILANGLVGIGTTTPSARLSLGDQTGQSFYVYEGSGASNVRAGLGIDMSGSSRELSIFCSSSTGFSNGNISFGYRLESNSAYQERMRLTSGGNLGIGTTSPGAKLHVMGTTGLPATSGTAFTGTMRLQVAGGYGTVMDFGAVGPATGTQWIQVTDSSNQAIQYPLLLQPNGGNVGIGTISATYKLHIKSSNNVSIFEDTSDAAGATFIVFNRPGVFSMGSITRNGAANSVSYNTGSDYRLKEDLKDFNALDLVNNITAYDYKWKNTEQRDYGFVAHELQQTLPNVVVGEKDGEKMQGVDYSKLTPILLKAIQELKAEIEILKNK